MDGWANADCHNQLALGPASPRTLCTLRESSTSCQIAQLGLEMFLQARAAGLYALDVPIRPFCVPGSPAPMLW